MDTGIDWAGLYAAGGPWAILAVALSVVAIVTAARWDWSKEKAEKAVAESPTVAAVNKLADKLDALTLLSERRLSASEARLDEHQRHLERLERRME